MAIDPSHSQSRCPRRIPEKYDKIINVSIRSKLECQMCFNNNLQHVIEENWYEALVL